MSSTDHLMTSLDRHNVILKQSNETRMQEDRRQLAAMHQMHREKMQMQQALIDPFSLKTRHNRTGNIGNILLTKAFLGEIFDGKILIISLL